MSAPTTPRVLTQLGTATLPPSLCRRFITIPPGRAMPCRDGVLDNCLVLVMQGRIGVQPASGLTMWFDTGDLLVLNVARGGRILNTEPTPASCCLISHQDPP